MNSTLIKTCQPKKCLLGCNGHSVEILKELPFRVQFKSERAVDTGGVSRDMFSSFWEEAYRKNFDGESLLLFWHMGS